MSMKAPMEKPESVTSIYTNQNLTGESPEKVEYRWPPDLYTEAVDMASISFLIYEFGLLIDIARKENGLIGLSDFKNDTDGERRSFSPEEVLDLVQNNIETLRKRYPKKFKEGQALTNLQNLIEKANQSDLERPLTLQEFDDNYQRHEMVYGITKDDINKRISVVFRGTENKLAFKTNWLSNVDLRKVTADLPQALEGVVHKIHLHSGFYNYIFSKTMDEKDDPTNRKYDVILKDCKILLEQNPGYKLYVTGHSLGAALSTIFAFYVACDEDIPKPVTCINFASPRVGSKNFRTATQWLEKRKMLRLLRFVNQNDSITTVPFFKYHHVGIGVRLYGSEEEPTIKYTGKGGCFCERFSQIWNNSIIANLNLSYDHKSYMTRIEKDKPALEKLDLNDLYKIYHPKD
eukprot:CAMPEP_0194141970 /NCGR_PEP_ID=MMETSP0152-20130528/11308_1 /TAXON_ID=1049557 /ORGANISM="Thalassiothrix antarctica, Strain L6-D1" /LENGTH=403 /DNA_ID=CAMNT_0038840763 /DNA_START=93 /DNA_END=1304 /DNA_ORIENTATION=-